MQCNAGGIEKGESKDGRRYAKMKYSCVCVFVCVVAGDYP